MNPTLYFALFTVLAFLLFMVEVFVPGGVIGAIGGASLLAACGFAIAAFGLSTGLLVSLLMMTGTLAGFIYWLSIMPNTRVGKRFALSHSLKTDQPESGPSPLLGKPGTAETDLRPGGFARIDGKKIDVIATRGYIEAGTPITVLEVHGSRVVVQETRPTDPIPSSGK